MTSRESATRDALLLAAGIVVLGAALVAAIRFTHAPDDEPVEAPVASASALDEMTGDPAFVAWLSAWREQDPYVQPSEFTLRENGAAIDAVLVPGDPGEEVRQRSVWSPGRKAYADRLAHEGEPDSSVIVYGIRGDGQGARVAFCGTPCGFDALFWLDDTRLVVLGAEDADVPGKRRLTATVFDFAANKKTAYVSASHAFSADANQSSGE